MADVQTSLLQTAASSTEPIKSATADKLLDKRQTTVTVSRTTLEQVDTIPTAPSEYKLVKVRKPDGTIVTVKRPVNPGPKPKLASVPANQSNSASSASPPVARGKTPSSAGNHEAAIAPPSTTPASAIATKPRAEEPPSTKPIALTGPTAGQARVKPVSAPSIEVSPSSSKQTNPSATLTGSAATIGSNLSMTSAKTTPAPPSKDSTRFLNKTINLLSLNNLDKALTAAEQFTQAIDAIADENLRKLHQGLGRGSAKQVGSPAVSGSNTSRATHSAPNASTTGSKSVVAKLTTIVNQAAAQITDATSVSARNAVSVTAVPTQGPPAKAVPAADPSKATTRMNAPAQANQPTTSNTNVLVADSRLPANIVSGSGPAARGATKPAVDNASRPARSTPVAASRDKATTATAAVPAPTVVDQKSSDLINKSRKPDSVASKQTAAAKVPNPKDTPAMRAGHASDIEKKRSVTPTANSSAGSHRPTSATAKPDPKPAPAATKTGTKSMDPAHNQRSGLQPEAKLATHSSTPVDNQRPDIYSVNNFQAEPTRSGPVNLQNYPQGQMFDEPHGTKTSLMSNLTANPGTLALGAGGAGFLAGGGATAAFDHWGDEDEVIEDYDPETDVLVDDGRNEIRNPQIDRQQYATREIDEVEDYDPETDEVVEEVDDHDYVPSARGANHSTIERTQQDEDEIEDYDPERDTLVDDDDDDDGSVPANHGRGIEDYGSDRDRDQLLEDDEQDVNNDNDNVHKYVDEADEDNRLHANSTHIYDHHDDDDNENDDDSDYDNGNNGLDDSD